MGGAEKIRVEFDTRVRFQEGQRCVFQYRLVNTGDSPVENLRVWFSAEGETEEKRQRILTLWPGKSSPFLFAWGPPLPGDVPLRFVLGVTPPGEETLGTYAVNLKATVTAAPRAESYSTVINYTGGQYQVGDTQFQFDRGQKTAGQTAEGISVDLEQGWSVLELFRDDTEAHARLCELRVEKFKELLADVEARFEHALALKSLGPTAPHAERLSKLIEEAHQRAEEALSYAAEGLRLGIYFRECRKVIEAYSKELPRKGVHRSEAPTPSPSLLVDEAGGILRRGNEGRHHLDVFLITKPVVQWGRHSEMDVFLAVEPSERPAGDPPWSLTGAPEAHRNYVRSTDLSRKPHFITRWREDGLAVEDRSARGTWLERHGERRKLPKGVATILSNGDRLHLAANSESGDDPALSLEVLFPGLGFRGRYISDHPTGFAGSGGPVPKSVVFRRLNNRPERQYVLLHGEACIGRNPDSAIVLEGEGIQEQHALVTLVNGCVAVRRLGDGYVAVDGQEVPPGEAVILPDRAEVRFGKVLMEFRRFHPTEKAPS